MDIISNFMESFVVIIEASFHIIRLGLEVDIIKSDSSYKKLAKLIWSCFHSL